MMSWPAIAYATVAIFRCLKSGLAQLIKLPGEEKVWPATYLVLATSALTFTVIKLNQLFHSASNAFGHVSGTHGWDEAAFKSSVVLSVMLYLTTLAIVLSLVLYLPPFINWIKGRMIGASVLVAAWATLMFLVRDIHFGWLRLDFVILIVVPTILTSFAILPGLHQMVDECETIDACAFTNYLKKSEPPSPKQTLDSDSYHASENSRRTVGTEESNPTTSNIP